MMPYESTTHGKLVDSVRCAVVTRWAPGPIKQYLRTLPLEQLGCWNDLKEALRLYRLRGQVYDSQGEVEYHVGHEPMEVDALKGGGKGRGFGSAKSRGRGGCFLCGQQGHIQANCSMKGK